MIVFGPDLQKTVLINGSVDPNKITLMPDGSQIYDDGKACHRAPPGWTFKSLEEVQKQIRDTGTQVAKTINGGGLPTLAIVGVPVAGAINSIWAKLRMPEGFRHVASYWRGETSGAAGALENFATEKINLGGHRVLGQALLDTSRMVQSMAESLLGVKRGTEFCRIFGALLDVLENQKLIAPKGMIKPGSYVESLLRYAGEGDKSGIKASLIRLNSAINKGNLKVAGSDLLTAKLNVHLQDLLSMLP